ncbi:MAG: class I SAM-dependent methyltransferase [Deltaproteobacteria bacterium]|nr:class I SAM-dependent methyltransferase [Deltaproteobacteria bacterium]
MSERNPYVGAYPWLTGRAGIWREIARYVMRDAPGAQAVLDLGAGYCDFINQVTARTRIAFDLNPDMTAHAAPGVDPRVGDCRGLPGVDEGSMDAVFASNFLEHFALDEATALLRDIHRVLRPAGRLLLIQPNYLRNPDHYWDDPTHKTAFHHLNLHGLLERGGFRVLRVVPGLLPFSMKSRLPKIPLLVRFYLRSPIRPLAAQMYAVAERA